MQRCSSKRSTQALSNKAEESVEARRSQSHGENRDAMNIESPIFTTNNRTRLNHTMGENDRNNLNDHTAETHTSEDGPLTWQEVANTLDWACFLLFSLLTLTADSKRRHVVDMHHLQRL